MKNNCFLAGIMLTIVAAGCAIPQALPRFASPSTPMPPPYVPVRFSVSRFCPAMSARREARSPVEPLHAAALRLD